MVCAGYANAVTGFAEDRHLGLAIQLDTAVKALTEIAKVRVADYEDVMMRDYWFNWVETYRKMARESLAKIKAQPSDLPEKSGD